ncbi:DNA double-strand break repair protein Rad50 [Paulownia witches'-broom phytoplasma]|uniref:DNA double-strand break repair protein Rad50 n=1 Tax=Paulownia witches'-broom phytoplasma TaxID=39647 RepID=A0ABX8TRN7_9MOLU|nr:DNA double-strand break repair protein Rad50 [Paulownia witches'-broom phytoplasma]QYC30737.1 DNA double-strand break repair protein Rad50 [Paulownia witches'-broom phytoplasma]
MLTPLDLFKGFINFRAYYTWAITAISIFSIFFFFKRKYDNTHNNYSTTWKGYLVYFLIILFLFSFIYLSFFKTPPSSKYVGQLIGEIDKAIDKYDETINNYKGLKSEWEGELKKCEDELKELYKAKEITQEQKEKIKEILGKNEGKIKELKEQLKDNTGNIAILKGKLLQLEQDKEAKEKEIKQKQEEEKLASPDDKIRLQAKISKLQDERNEIMEQIAQVLTQIGKLEAAQKKYENMLSNAIKLKESIQRDFNELTSGEQQLFTKIKNEEDRRAEIQKNIDEIDVKTATIEIERKQLEILRQGADASKIALDDWDKKHEFSFGNLRDALFQGAELYMDAFGGRGFLKAVAGGVTKKVAGTIAKAGLVVHETHRVINLAKDIFVNKDGTPKMMSKETYDSICSRIDRETDKLDADYKDYKKKKEEYETRQKTVNLKKEIQTEKNQLTEFKQQDESVIKEYETITEDLTNKLKEVSGENVQKLRLKENDLRELCKTKNEEIVNTKEELKQKNPSYARAQKRYEEKQKEKKYAKFFQPITNK